MERVGESPYGANVTKTGDAVDVLIDQASIVYLFAGDRGSRYWVEFWKRIK